MISQKVLSRSVNFDNLELFYWEYRYVVALVATPVPDFGNKLAIQRLPR